MKDTWTIRCYESDALRHLKPFAFMNTAQELANTHAIQLGFGYNQLIEKELIWVLSRMHVKYLRAPLWQETVSVETWHKGENGIFSLRDFLVSDGDGKPLVLATSSWLVIHARTRRIQRADHIFGPEEIRTQEKRHAIEEPCDKITMPGEALLNYWGVRKVMTSDIDFNQHTNNAKYMEWACDCIPADVVTTFPVDDFSINFNTESRLSDLVELYTAQTDQLTYYIEGRKETRNVFQAEIRFKKEKSS
ncbi:MAG: acyl-ACP thioesterase domain-containing protein [Bacteroidales bacterium]|nr:thioesterase [Bacteroidales bacterium]MDD4655661.1 thioesterase [Bacteroidales bacterium]MDD4827707.1 thioesterase [Bacteroidales bacterium]